MISSGRAEQAGEAVRYCADAVRRHDPGRYLTAISAPPAPRASLFALYAFNLELAKAVDQTSEPLLGEIRIEWWREAIEALFQGQTRQHMVLAALAETLARTPLDRGMFDALMVARVADLQTERYRGLTGLVHHAEESGGRLARLALETLGRSDDGCRAAACDVGTAWTLVGLMRSIGHHASRRRLYLPLDQLQAEGLTAEDVFARRFDVRLGKVVAEVMGVAGERIGASRLRLRKPPAWALPVLLTATFAEAYADRFASRGHDPFGPEITLGNVRPPLLIAWKRLLGRF
jgi:phytoene synthase